jgi:site-specific recombinase XerD
LVARGGPRERIARLSLEAHIDLSLYLELRRDLFGLGSEALFVSTRGARERLPLRSIAQNIQSQIENASLEERMNPADLARYPAAKFISEGTAPHHAVLMLGYKRIPGVYKGPTMPRTSDALKLFHPLHS